MCMHVFVCVQVENSPASVSLSSSSSSSKDEDGGMSSSDIPSTEENERRKVFQQDEAQYSTEENQSAGGKDEFETVYLSKMVETFDESLEAMQLQDTQKGKLVPTRVLLQALESISPSLFSELERSEFMKSFNSS